VLAGLASGVGLYAPAHGSEMQERDGISEPGEDGTPGDAAAYIASLVDELARLAKRHHLDSLGYILDMARLEAEQISKGAARNLR